MADSPADSPTVRKPLLLTTFGILGILALLSLPFLPLFEDGETMPDFARFIGHFHPVVLHLPIGVFILVLLQEIFGFSRNSQEKGVGFPLAFGVWSSIAAVIAGYMLWRSGDGAYGDLGERHLWGGTLFTCGVIATAVIKKWALLNGWMVISYKLPLVASVGIMGFTSHDGGSMTHGSDFLTKYAPASIKKLLGDEGETDDGPPSEIPLIYTDVVEPIFERRCVACHKEGKAKGNLRMDSFELLMKGGKEGPAVVLGNAEESNIVVRMLLPLDDEEHMPPEDKPQPEADELKVIRWWIDSGADNKVSLAEVEMPDEIKAIVSELVKMPAASDVGKSVEPEGHGKPDKALQEQVAKLAATYPGSVTFESQQSSGVVLSAVALRAKLGDGEFADFAPLLPHLVSADLSATSIGDSSVSLLKDAARLRMLRLSQTAVSDKSMEVLAALSELESLNLYGTAVTDEGLMKLATLPKLKRLYLWQTKVTSEGVAKFKAELPECEVVVGVE